MTRPVSRWRVIGAIIRKDLAEYRRDLVWLGLTIFGLVIFVALFWVLPDDVDETITIGVAPGVEVLADAGSLPTDVPVTLPGFGFVSVQSADDLEAVVAGKARLYRRGAETVAVRGGRPPEGFEKVGDVQMGIAFPPGFVDDFARGSTPTVTVFVDAAVPEDVRRALAGFIGEIAAGASGTTSPLAEADVEILGEDRAGNQITPRDSFRPLFAFMVLLMEGFVMSSLIAAEVQTRTVTALLVTPATVGDVLAAKGLTGVLTGMAQVVVLLVATGSLAHEPALVLSLMLLGAVMISGIAMIAGAAGRDFMGTLFLGMALMVPLMIPAFAAIFPGTASIWVQALPTYPLVDGLVDVTNYGAGWSDATASFLVLGGWCVAIFATGWFVLRRKVASL